MDLLLTSLIWCGFDVIPSVSTSAISRSSSSKREDIEEELALWSVEPVLDLVWLVGLTPDLRVGVGNYWEMTGCSGVVKALGNC